MIKPARYGKRHFDRAGFSLGEWALVLACAVMSISVVAGSAACRVDQARARRTLADMRAILEAGQRYYAVRGAWPADIQQAGAFLASIPSANPWGREYRLAYSEARSWVETRVPQEVTMPLGKDPMVLAGVSGAEVIWRMIVPVAYGSTARLVYERK